VGIRGEALRLSELSLPDLVVARRETALCEAALAMVRRRVRHVAAVDEAGRLGGVVVDWLLFSHGGFVDGDDGWLPYRPEHTSLTCGDIAVGCDVVVHPTDEVSTTLARMGKSPQDCAIVVDDDGRPVGMLTDHDAVRIVLEHVPAALDMAEVGTAPVLTVSRDLSAAGALQAMRSHGVHHLVVLDVDGGVFGVVSHGDLVADDVVGRPDLTVDQVVRPSHVRTVPLGTPLRAIARILLREGIGCVPIVDAARRPVAIVTRRDVMRAGARDL
jgi:CBS domain-containing protein